MNINWIFSSHAIAIYGFACLVLSALAAFWAMIKLSYQRALGRPMPRNALTGTLDVLAELANNVVGAVSRALKLGGIGGLFQATMPPAPSNRPTLPPQAGRSMIAVLFVVMTLGMIVVPLGILLLGCPHLPPVSGCTPMSQRCDADRPYVCSASQRWEPAGDSPCGDVGGVCIVLGDVAHCARAQDGGAE